MKSGNDVKKHRPGENPEPAEPKKAYKTEDERKKLLFLFNPTSGKGQIRTKLVDILNVFVGGGYEVTAHPTQAENDAREMVELHAPEYDLVVCSGGDGTLNEAVSGMMALEDRRPLGYIPAGTTNDFAQSLEIPKDMVEAAKLAVGGDEFAIDIGKFDHSYFTYVAAFGVFTDVSYQTSQSLKHVLGHGAYVVEGVKRLKDIPSYAMEVEANGEVIRGNFIYGMIANSHSVGGIKNMMGSGICLDDGLLEVNLIKYPQNPVQLNEILTNLMMPKNLDTEYIYRFKTDHIVLRSENPIPWTLDGEFGGDHRRAEITDCRQAVKIKAKHQRQGS